MPTMSSTFLALRHRRLLVENHNQFDPFAVLGDMGITSKWRWNNHFSISGGFQYMILDGVALIPDILGRFQTRIP